ncbi:LysR family transcriptional regulator [Marinobacterium arenosum]|uniref:LysR family transcriptional regulator n=1 Tax=Marinobacterium arenosum TaxID=2862496 RepID=UPI001C941113|nr:LysR family transcriptional regulator [Marinobacterium arenosum]MBY4677003.1 LysR family transcriptional regulator [Marinobacterium arenosum]
MDKRALKYFETVARLGSIRAASEVLHVAHSAISRQVKQLESELNVQLLERLGRGIEVTAAGGQLLSHIKDIQRREDDFLARLSDMQGLRIGTLRIATGGGLISDLLTGAISSFSRQHPGIRFVLNVCGGDEVIRQVRDDEVDLGLVLNCAADPQLDNLLSCPFPPLNLIVHPGSPQAQLEYCSLAQLQSLPLAMLNDSFSIRQLIRRFEEQHGVRFAPQLECNSFEALKIFVLAGLGGTLLPAFCTTREIQNGSLKAIPLAPAQQHSCSVDLIIRKGRERSAGIRAISEHIRQNMVAFQGLGSERLQPAKPDC